MNRTNIELIKFVIFLIITVLFSVLCLVTEVYSYLWIAVILGLATVWFFWKYQLFKKENAKRQYIIPISKNSPHSSYRVSSFSTYYEGSLSLSQYNFLI
jgi:heme O synthase-like polyprenyltransferase